MTVNLQSISISSLSSEKRSGCLMKEKKSYFKALVWLELARVSLNFVTKPL